MPCSYGLWIDRGSPDHDETINTFVLEKEKWIQNKGGPNCSDLLCLFTLNYLDDQPVLTGYLVDRDFLFIEKGQFIYAVIHEVKSLSTGYDRQTKKCTGADRCID